MLFFYIIENLYLKKKYDKCMTFIINSLIHLKFIIKNPYCVKINVMLLYNTN